MDSHSLVSFNGVVGHGLWTDYLSPRTPRHTGLASKAAALPGEKVCLNGDRVEPSFFAEEGPGRLSKARFYGRGGRFDGLFVKAASSDESSSGHGSKSEQLSEMLAPSARRAYKSSKKKGKRKEKEEEPCLDVHKREETPIDAEMPVLQSDKMEVKLQEMGEGTGSWTIADRKLLASTADKLEALRLHALALEQWHASSLLHVHRSYQKSARNLLHYLAVKSADLEDMQSCLPTLGLASIDGIEAHVLASLAHVIDAVRALSTGLASYIEMKSDDHSENRLYTEQLDSSSFVAHDTHNRVSNIDPLSSISIGSSRIELSNNTLALFGPRSSSGRKTYIMVTLSEEMADNESAVLDLMKAGMDVARINCSHGNPEVWGSLINTIKHCSQMLEQPCRVLMDLAGPKLRTSAFSPGPCVKKIKPQRDGCGNVIMPARVWLALPNTPVPEGKSADVMVPVEGDIWLGSLQIGDQLKLHDARGKPRQLTVTDKIMGSGGVGCWAECFSTTYLKAGTELEFLKKKGRKCKGYVADLPSPEHFIRLRKGDLLVLTKESYFPEANESHVKNSWVFRLQVSHTFGQLFESVRPGERIRFDDGKIEGIIRGVTSSEISVEVTFANEKGTKLGGEKSINLPDSNLCQKGLTVKDMVDLDFVVRHADMVGLSFVNNSKDLQVLQGALEKKGAASIGIVLKIETRSGVVNLPEILLQGMKRVNPLGVMIARGDLAVECGWESVAGVQEEVLHICKAAHIPTIWATQVLEGLAKQGLPTRPEITDAAFGGRAACIMLNKGLYIQKAVSVLDRILDQSVQPWWEEQARDRPFRISGLAD